MFSSNERAKWQGYSAATDDTPRLDRSVTIGLGLSLVLVLLAIVTSGEILRFLNPVSFFLVVAGSVGATLVQTSIPDVKNAFNAARESLFVKRESPYQRIQYFINLSQRTKQEGALILEDEASAVEDDFLRLGLELTVDGQPADEVRKILEHEMRSSQERAWRSVLVFESLANYAPAIGLIGTLIGLVQMLGALSDPAVVGPSMSLALVTTLYGAICANLIFFPMAGKLRMLATEKEQLKIISLEALSSLAKNESVVILEQRLQSFSPLVVNG